MDTIIQGAGGFIYPLALFSILTMYVIIERAFALRTKNVIPPEMTDAFISGDIVNHQGDMKSVAGRIVYFFRHTNPDSDALKAFARLEIIRLERGLFILEIVISGAPLLGLLGTITGLAEAFSAQLAKTGMPDKEHFVQGIALALTTTMVGLCIAIPALIANSYFHRRVELLATKLEVGVERLIDLSKRR
ncbi:MAG TPA: MotA/TolQ/ExbB proton channel family protein [Opitutales bacterium]|jgi:biopolymer transport protein ExbB|nr:MotA/TolQ/ExbB proton channel family protein [Opitutales bacterium]